MKIPVSYTHLTITYKTLTNGSLFYVTNTKDTTWTFGSLEVAKMWVSASDSESIPDKVQVKLMRQQIDGQGNAVEDTQVLVDQYWILASQQWKLTIQDLPLYSDADNSVRYTYWVEEVLAENSDWEADVYKRQMIWRSLHSPFSCRCFGAVSLFPQYIF